MVGLFARKTAVFLLAASLSAALPLANPKLKVCAAAEPQNVGLRLQQVSVNVRAGGSQGSGTLVLVEVDGKPESWVITAAHVVDRLREVHDIIGPDGTPKKEVSYLDAEILQERVADGRTVGESRYDAKVICVDSRRDIALLRVRAGKVSDAGASVWLDEKIPEPGTEIYHAGAPGGSQVGGSATLTSGIVSRIGVRIPEFGSSEAGVYDQVDCAALPGSSGGLVALKTDGRWIGMITLGVPGSDSFHWFVPVRSLRSFAKQAKCEWLFRSPMKTTSAEISAIPLELTRAAPSGGSPNRAIRDDLHRPLPALPALQHDVVK